MRNKESEKLFKLAYTDAMTGLYNRAAYEERLAKLRKSTARLDNIMVVVAEIDDLFTIDDIAGKMVGDNVVKAMANTLTRTIGKKADIYQLGGYYFVCIAEREIFSYVSEFKDLLSFENRDRLYPFSVNLGYSSFNPKKHKTIDDLVLDCDKKLMEHKPKIQIY